MPRTGRKSGSRQRASKTNISAPGSTTICSRVGPRTKTCKLKGQTIPRRKPASSRREHVRREWRGRPRRQEAAHGGATRRQTDVCTKIGTRTGASTKSRCLTVRTAVRILSMLVGALHSTRKGGQGRRVSNSNKPLVAIFTGITLVRNQVRAEVARGIPLKGGNGVQMGIATMGHTTSSITSSRSSRRQGRELQELGQLSGEARRSEISVGTRCGC